MLRRWIERHGAGWRWRWHTREAVTMLLGAAALALVSDPPATVERPPVLRLDPNRAPLGVLLALPRMGPTLARRIVAERERRPYATLAELTARVRGIGPATATALRPSLQFHTPHEP